MHACRAWLAEPPTPRHYLVAEVGTAVLNATHLLEWADCLLILDAMCAGGPPGTLYSARPDELEAEPAKVSLHDLSLLGALRMLPRRPQRIAIMGVEPESIAVGTELSVAVARAVPKLVLEAKRVLTRWQNE